MHTNAQICKAVKIFLIKRFVFHTHSVVQLFRQVSDVFISVWFLATSEIKTTGHLCDDSFPCLLFSVPPT